MSTLKECALVIVGHGSTSHAGASAATRLLSQRIADRNIVAQVKYCFYKQAPFLEDAFVGIESTTTIIVPHFTGRGYYTDTLIPKRLEANIHLLPAGARMIYTPPVGTHPTIPALIENQAIAALEQHDLKRSDTSLLLIGHGSSRPGGASATLENLAATLRERRVFNDIVTLYLEEAPYATAWRDHVRTRQIVALPFLISDGMHGSSDIPPLFGLETGQSGLSHIADRTILLRPPIGMAAEMADIVLDLAQTSLKDALS